VLLRDIVAVTTTPEATRLWQQDEEIAGRTYWWLAMQKDEQDPLALLPLLSAVVFAGSCAFCS
jgi:hypothetical protein